MDFDTSSPIWLQLVSEFSRRIVTGEWEAGERIPGVRELALQLGVNPNTVQRTLGEMEREGLCRSERTAGRFVTDDAQRISALRRALVTEAADEYVRVGRGLGMDIADALALIDERWRRSDDEIDDKTGTKG
ncbi:MAG: GntR family transcriptional regulator [Arachnia sp.]